MVKIVTYAHKRPDFIILQYESIKKHLKSTYEYVVFNNSIDDQKSYEEIKTICKNLNIRCIDVELIDELRVTQGDTNFNGNKYTNPNLACSYPIIWSFKKIFNEEDDIICIIDSDMFFIKDIDIEHEISNKDIICIPQYRDKGKIKYLWNAFVCLNIKRNKNLLSLNWHPGSINGVGCDVGGQTHFNLKENNYDIVVVEEFSIYDIKYNNNYKKISYIQNGNISFDVNIKDELISVVHTSGDKIYENRSFSHEMEFDDHEKYIFNRVCTINSIFENHNLNFPDPKHIAFIGFPNKIDYFIVHYKSGSNYLRFTTDEYNRLKTIELKKLLSNDNI